MSDNPFDEPMDQDRTVIHPMPGGWRGPAATPVPATASTVWRCLNRHGMTFKKTAHAAEQERADVAVRRRAWFAAQPDLDPQRLVFIDGSGFSE